MPIGGYMYSRGFKFHLYKKINQLHVYRFNNCKEKQNKKYKETTKQMLHIPCIPFALYFKRDPARPPPPPLPQSGKPREVPCRQFLPQPLLLSSASIMNQQLSFLVRSCPFASNNLSCYQNKQNWRKQKTAKTKTSLLWYPLPDNSPFLCYLSYWNFSKMLLIRSIYHFPQFLFIS